MLRFVDFKTLFRIFWKSISLQDKQTIPQSSKRLLVTFVFYTVYTVILVFNTICFQLDKIFFRNYKSFLTNDPIFIIGNPRSGTTYLHRLMAIDQNRFFVFKAWEILFPSIIQKKLLSKLGKLDKKFGSYFYKKIQEREIRSLQRFNQVHPTGLFLPEECELLLMHIFSTYNLFFFLPIENEFRWFKHFDTVLSPADKNRILTFYDECIKRQALYLNHHGHLLSKSPGFSSKIDSLAKKFPRCRFIYLLRSPLEVVPSIYSLVQTISEHTTGFVMTKEMIDDIYEMICEFYTYPIEYFNRNIIHPSRFAIIFYKDLISKPSKVISELYQTFGFDFSPSHMELLKAEDEKASRYKSRHKYSLNDFNLEEKRLHQDLGHIIRMCQP